MLTSGDIVDVDLGLPSGREAGLRHPAVVVTAQRILDASPTVVHVVPVTSAKRDLASEVTIGSERATGLDRPSSAQCQHVRAVSTRRIEGVRGNVGATALAQIREVIGVVLDVPT